MTPQLPRRTFMGRLAAALATGIFLGGCRSREEAGSAKAETGSNANAAESGRNGLSADTVPGQSGMSPDADPGPETRSSGPDFRKKLAELRQMPRELVMQLLDQKVDRYMQLSHHCAQSSFLALKEQFGLNGADVVKALTPLAGIAERGETCGAVTGPLMAYGLIYGRSTVQLQDWDTYRASLVPSGRFCRAFEEAFGTTDCHEIQKGEFGRCYQLTDPEELRLFQEAGATEHCSAVVRKAVRLAAGIILDYDPGPA